MLSTEAQRLSGHGLPVAMGLMKYIISSTTNCCASSKSTHKRMTSNQYNDYSRLGKREKDPTNLRMELLQMT